MHHQLVNILFFVILCVLGQEEQLFFRSFENRLLDLSYIGSIDRIKMLLSKDPETITSEEPIYNINSVGMS